MEHIRYKKETEVVTFQGKEITLENLSPVFTLEMLPSRTGRLRGGERAWAQTRASKQATAQEPAQMRA